MSDRVITSVMVIVALVESIILVFSLEREQLLLRWFAEGRRASTARFYTLWESWSDLIVETLLLFIVRVIGSTTQQIMASVRGGEQTVGLHYN